MVSERVKYVAYVPTLFSFCGGMHVLESIIDDYRRINMICHDCGYLFLLRLIFFPPLHILM